MNNMDDKPKLQPYGDITYVTGKYMKDGKEKNRYTKIGTLFATPHLSHMSIKLEALPIGGDGWLNIFKRDDAPQVALPERKDVVLEDISDDPIDLSSIPF